VGVGLLLGVVVSAARAGDMLLAVSELADGRPAGTIFPAPGEAAVPGTVRIQEDEWRTILEGKATLLMSEVVATGEQRRALAAGMIRAGVADCMGVLRDYEHYLELFPELEECTIVRRLDESRLLIAFQIFSSWPKKKYYTHVITEQPDGVTFRLAQPEDIAPFAGAPDYEQVKEYVERSLDDFRINRGSWRFIPLPAHKGHVMALYSISMRLQGAIMGSSLATKMLNSLSRDNMPNVVMTVKREAERRHESAPAARGS
jgi:hypothetical protein